MKPKNGTPGMVYIAFPQIDYPKDSDMMQVFECQETLQYKYAVTLLAVMHDCIYIHTMF